MENNNEVLLRVTNHTGQAEKNLLGPAEIFFEVIKILPCFILLKFIIPFNFKFLKFLKLSLAGLETLCRRLATLNCYLLQQVIVTRVLIRQVIGDNL